MKNTNPGKILILIAACFFSNSALASDRDACVRISAGALVTKTKTLVIAIEGLMSFNASKTKQAYDHRCRVTRGLASSPPKVGKFGGYVLKNIVIPGIDEYKNKVEFVVVPYTDALKKNGKAFHCAKIWKEETAEGSDGRRVFLVGHSFGGYALTKLTENLGNIPVDGVISIDPRHTVILQPPMHRKGNVSRWENYYQKFGGLPGYQIQGADLNQRLHGKGHTGLPGHQSVVGAFKRMIGEPSGESVLAFDPNLSCGPSKWVGKNGNFERQGMKGNKDMTSHKGSGISGVTDEGSDSKIPVPTRNPRRTASGGSDDGSNIPIPERNPRKPLPEQETAETVAPTNKGVKGITTVGGKSWDAPAWWDGWGGTRESGRSRMGSAPKPAGADSSDSDASSGEVAQGEVPAENTRFQRDSLSLAGNSALMGNGPDSAASDQNLVTGSIDGDGGALQNSGSSRSLASKSSKSPAQEVVVAAILESKEETSQAEATLFSRVNKKIKSYLGK